MILLDFSQIMHLHLNGIPANEMSEKAVFTTLTNALRLYNKKFRGKYGDLVVCLDARRSWRKDVFSQYKAARKAARSKSAIDWSSVFPWIDKFIVEVQTSFPYKTAYADGAEGDDVIGVIVAKFSRYDKVLIVSEDKDFQQLQKYPNVEQFAPRKRSFLVCDDPVAFLNEHVLTGDSVDGIPNILSADDVFVDPDKRQTKLTSKVKKLWLEQSPKDFCDSVDMKRRYIRNRTTIDLSSVPTSIAQAIEDQYHQPAGGNRTTLSKWLVAQQMGLLYDSLTDF